MNIDRKYISLYIGVLLCFYAFGQSQFNLSKPKSSKIRFQLINNIIVMTVELNGVKLSFVLDTGVSRPILFNLINVDSLQIKNTEVSYLQGLGNNGTIEAIKSTGNIIKIGEAISINTDVSMVFDPSINFTPRLGVPVHGIIGYDVFKDFIVEINYGSKYVRFHKPRSFKKPKSDKWKNLPLEIIDNKPYLKAQVELNNKKTDVKLLMDTGSSDALWLFEKSNSFIEVPKERYFEDFLGKGLSGPVYGKRSKAQALSIDEFTLKDVNIAFPDSIYLSIARNMKSRNGSVSGNVLKRFNLFFDYKNQNLWFRKNGNFKSPFYYNNSGITLEQRGVRVVKKNIKTTAIDSYGNRRESGQSINVVDSYKFVLKPSFQVVELREGSNAQKAGIKIGDIVLSINGKDASELSLQGVNKFFYNKRGAPIKLRVERDGNSKLFRFQLDDVFQKKEPSQ